jgi:hypothetical protein
MTAVMALSGETQAGRGLETDVALAAGGDQSAFERLYRTHVARIHSLTRRMLSTQEADEVTQDIFVRTWQKLGQFRGESAFSTSSLNGDDRLRSSGSGCLTTRSPSTI